MEIIIFSLAAIAVLITISGFLAGAETAITGVSQPTIHRLKQEGNKQAKIVSELRANKEKLVSALLLGSGVCNSYAITIFGIMLTNLFDEEVSLFYTPIIMTIIIFVFSEALPKTYAFENAEKYSLKTSPILIKIVKILYPIINLIQIIVDYILAIFCKKDDKHYSVISATEELRGAIDLHHHEGAVVKSDRDMLGSILDLKDTEVEKVMVHRSNIISINIDQPVQDILQQAINSNHTRFPVWKRDVDNIVGILNIKDLLKAICLFEGNLTKINIKEILTAPWFIPETTILSEQLHEFRQRRNHFSLVIDEYGAVLGIVTLEDILEVIVGEIEDEHDQMQSGIIPNSDGTYLLEGSVNIRDLNRQLDLNLPMENASTIAGLIMHETEKVPEVGEVFELYNMKFTIAVKHYNQIKMVQAEILNPKEDFED